MADLPSRLDLYSIGRQYVLDHAKKIDPAVVDVRGSEANIFVGSMSVVGDAIVKQLGYGLSRLTLDGAFDEDLDRYSLDHFNDTLPRKGASPAVGSVRFARPTSTLGAGQIPVGTRIRTNGGVEYYLTSSAVFGATVTDNVKANVRAVQAGKATQVGANTLRGFVKPGDIWDPSIVLTNDGPTAGGEDRESDDDYKVRIRNFWAAAQKGVLAAIEQGALTVPGVVSAQAVEALTGDALPARVILLYIADSSGLSNQALANQVQVALNEFRAGGITVLISTSLPLLVSIQLRLTFQAGVDTQVLANTIRTAIFGFVNSLPVNGTLLQADLTTVLKRYTGDGLIVNQGSVVSPVGDLVPAVGQTIRTTLDRISYDVTA